jgi:hypothetical protein
MCGGPQSSRSLQHRAVLRKVAPTMAGSSWTDEPRARRANQERRIKTMNERADFTTSPFDAIRKTDEQGNEHWSARELYKILGYTQWRNFQIVVVKRAMKACEEDGRDASDHFVRSYKMIQLGGGSERKTEDILLSRYISL